MHKIKYSIGGLEFDPDTLRSGHSVDFVIGLEGDDARFYAKQYAGGHTGVAAAFGLGTLGEKKFVPIPGKRIVGGASIRIYTTDLILRGYSTSFFAIPKEVAKDFGELLKPELERMGIPINRIKADTYGELNPYWIEMGFVGNS